MTREELYAEVREDAEGCCAFQPHSFPCQFHSGMFAAVNMVLARIAAESDQA